MKIIVTFCGGVIVTFCGGVVVVLLIVSVVNVHKRNANILCIDLCLVGISLKFLRKNGF